MTQIIGTIKLIKETVQVSEKFSKREIVVTDNSMYPQDIIMQFTQDKCSVLDGFKENEAVTVDINIRGREWISPQGEVKYFNTLEGWKISKGENSTPGESKAPKVAQAESADDDLPF